MSRGPLAILIELAAEARETAARLLAGERRGERQLAEQLGLLEQYRLEYVQRLDGLWEQGLTRAELENYQGFLASLDAAITAAREGLSQQAGKVARCQEHWREARLRENAYGTLSARRDAQQARQEARGDARRQDEFSTNRYVRDRQERSSDISGK